MLLTAGSLWLDLWAPIYSPKDLLPSFTYFILNRWYGFSTICVWTDQNSNMDISVELTSSILRFLTGSWLWYNLTEYDYFADVKNTKYRVYWFVLLLIHGTYAKWMFHRIPRQMQWRYITHSNDTRLWIHFAISILNKFISNATVSNIPMRRKIYFQTDFCSIVV